MLNFHCGSSCGGGHYYDDGYFFKIDPTKDSWGEFTIEVDVKEIKRIEEDGTYIYDTDDSD